MKLFSAVFFINQATIVNFFLHTFHLIFYQPKEIRELLASHMRSVIFTAFKSQIE